MTDTELEEVQSRVKACNDAIREALQKYDCMLQVPKLDISTGRIFPIVQVTPKPTQNKIARPNGLTESNAPNQGR